MKRAALLESKIRPFATKLADDIVALIEGRLEKQLERAGAVVVEALRAAFDGDMAMPAIADAEPKALPEPIARRDPKPSKAPRVKQIAARATAPKTSGNGPSWVVDAVFDDNEEHDASSVVKASDLKDRQVYDAFKQLLRTGRIVRVRQGVYKRAPGEKPLRETAA